MFHHSEKSKSKQLFHCIKNGMFGELVTGGHRSARRYLTGQGRNSTKTFRAGGTTAFHKQPGVPT